MNLWREHPVLSAAVALLVVGVVAVLWRLRQRLVRSEHERHRAAEELNRRLSELFSLQELSYVLSDCSSWIASSSRWCATPCDFSTRRAPCWRCWEMRPAIPSGSPPPKARWR